MGSCPARARTSRPARRPGAVRTPPRAPTRQRVLPFAHPSLPNLPAGRSRFHPQPSRDEPPLPLIVGLWVVWTRNPTISVGDGGCRLPRGCRRATFRLVTEGAVPGAAIRNDLAGDLSRRQFLGRAGALGLGALI